MTNTLKIIQHLNTPVPQKRKQPTKNRRLRRQEERDRVKASKLIQKKIGQLSA